MKIQQNLDKRDKLIWSIVFMLLLIFFLSSFFSQFLRQFVGIVLIFIVPGMIVLSHYKREEIVAFSSVISISLIIALSLFMNIWLGIKIDNMFLDKTLLILFIGIFLYKFFISKYQSKGDEKHCNLDKYFILILLISVIFRILIISNIGSLIGTDITRFAIISHVMKLKEQISLDLRPYDMAHSFFYFPLSFVLPLILETLNIDPITSITYFSFFFNILTIVAFYLFASRILDNKKALYATFFYSIFFDLSLDYLMSRGVFSFAISFLPTFLLMYLFIEFFDEKRKITLLFFSFLFLIFAHWYLLFVLISFLFSLILYEYWNKQSFCKSKDFLFTLLKIAPLILLFISPFLIYFLPSYNVYRSDKLADWKIYEIGMEKASLKDKITAIIFNNFATVTTPVIYSLGFLVSILMINELVKNKKLIILIFFILIIFSSIFYVNSITWKRSADYAKIVYPISFSLLFNHPVFIAVSLASSPFIENTPIWYYLAIPNNVEKEQSSFFDVVSEDELKAFDFIKANISENSTFLIDGGGAGCIGGQPFSHGERIFPLTSRRLFYFTNSCPTNFDWKEYQKRVDLYRKISIDPNDQKTLDELKNNYNLTHIYIGYNHVGLDPDMFNASKNYKLIYHEKNIYIFEIV